MQQREALTLLCQDLLGTPGLLQLLGHVPVPLDPVGVRPNLLEQQHGQVGSCTSASQNFPARKIKLHFGRWNDVPVCEWQHLLPVRCSRAASLADAGATEQPGGPWP